MSTRAAGSAEWRARPSSVATALKFPGSPEEIWEKLMFYEQIPNRPPLYLRLLLPAPQRAEGGGLAVGDEIRCVYEKGYLIKRLVRIDQGRCCRFDVIEQDLEIRGGIRLIGGSYAFHPLRDGSTRVELETRYVSRRRPAWLWKPIESAVCHAFHRHILGAMRRTVPVSGSPPRLARRIGRSRRLRIGSWSIATRTSEKVSPDEGSDA